MSLAEARDRRDEAKKMISKGIDPSADRKEKTSRHLKRPSAPMSADCKWNYDGNFMLAIYGQRYTLGTCFGPGRGTEVRVSLSVHSAEVLLWYASSAVQNI